MDLMNDLRALLQHDVQLLYSCEKQITEALPLMIQRATNTSLKQALEQHLEVTKQQRDTIDKVREMLGANEYSVKQYSGLLANIMDGAKCKGMAGLIEEGEKVMAENLSNAVLDAAIIGCAQKIEHYEIAAYGTAKTYAQELGLDDIASLLEGILSEEHQANNKLTSLAESGVNKDAQISATNYASQL